MSKTIDFYYDYISPASYIAWTQIEKVAERTGASINYKPMLLGGVFKIQGTTSPVTNPAKWDWIQKDFQRFADHYQIPYQHNPHFIYSTISALRGAMWAKSVNRLQEYNQAMFTAAWADGKDLADKAVLAEILTAADFDADEVIAAMVEPDNKAALIQATEEAAERGVFGAPSFIVDGVLHFGQDRLDWVEALAKG